ncbi:hypothetical protein KR044_000253, partial [Drosophila immigrans]
EELLGSVTTQNCPGTRASARVIQKMKLDLTRPMTPPPTEREHSKKEEKGSQKTPSQMRAANKTTWTNLERNCFFDALNEFGKDFEAVANCINTKLKRRNTSSEYSFKSKDQVRQHYYQTYHKISKYVRYSDELKKPAQELYTLINYGEMRRKLQFLTEKHFMKLKQLIYQGHIIVRCKGKNIRIKTPSCKALRRLNQLDDTLEDIRLPSKIEVLVTPANMEAFGRVQSLAQNPRARAIVPLHKKLISFIKTFQYKWRSADVRLAEEQLLLNNSAAVEPGATVALEPPIVDPALCLLPKPGVPIHRPLLSITAYLSSVNICLTAYEERLGVKVRSETVESTAAAAAASAKRARTESGSEKRSPEAKKLKPQCSPAHEKSSDDLVLKMENSSGDELSEEINELLSQPTSSSEAVDTTSSNSSQVNPANANAATAPTPVATAAAPPRAKRQDAPGAGGGKGSRAAAAAAARNFKPLLSDEVIKRIRKGWTVSTSADITIGDLYVVLGQDSKLELEYYWCDAELSTSSGSTSVSTTTTTAATTASSSSSTSSSATGATSTPPSSSASLPYNTNDCDSVERVKAIQTATVSNKLKHLLLVANLSERVRKRQCNCGHSCDRKRDLITKAQWLNSLANGTASAAAVGVGVGAGASAANAAGDGSESIFRTPMIPMRRPISSLMDPVRQLTKLTRQKMSRQVLVQRCILPASSDVSRPYDVLSLRNLQNGLFEPIERVSSSSHGNHGNGSGNGHISSTLALSLPVSGKVNSTSNRSNSLPPLPESSSSSSDSGCVVSGLLDMPNLDVGETTTSLSSALIPASSSSASLPDGAQDESTTQNFFTGSVSPMHLLRDSTSNARWLEENINDFSLTSLLGHLDDFDATRDILDPSSSLSVISESSVDFRHKFQEISALLQQQEKD